MDHEQFARRVLGMPPASTNEPSAVDGVAAVSSRPCTVCGRLTTAVFIDATTLGPEPARCRPCREDYLGGLTFSLVDDGDAVEWAD